MVLRPDLLHPSESSCETYPLIGIEIGVLKADPDDSVHSLTAGTGQGLMAIISRFENRTKVFCILSDARAFQAKSPEMFSAVLKRAGLNAVYVPFMVAPENLGQAVHSLRVLNIAGANITVPYKEAVIPYLDILSEGANIIGAINTIVRDGERLKGYNTNAIGFMDAMEAAGFDAAGKTALVFGTGGAARAVAFIFNWLRAERVLVAGRSLQKAHALTDKLGGVPLLMDTLAGTEIHADILVNATAVSSTEESPELADLVARLNLQGCGLVVDLNYGRIQNFWQERAAGIGAKFVDGLRPLAYQARRSFALWTKLQVPVREFMGAVQG
jgi:shikimate dehydrogenase